MRLAALAESHEAFGYDRLPKVMYGQSVKSAAKLDMSVCRAGLRAPSRELETM